eukprot:TRINITY_DN6177_c0_g3_i1.p1 TRINITY_DN6177_c0_g3~~TRINITY_DN6177_c0_g3_i1.p1  ORF type:complete len:327 (+),score=66.79 TRINITY_DN6177_c0_g3_i1:56-1036(+)
MPDPASDDAQPNEDNHDDYLIVPQGVPMELGCTSIPAKMTVAGMRLFGSAGLMVGKMYMKKALHGVSHGSATGFLSNVAQCTLLSGAIEAQAARQVIVRIPVFGESFVNRFMQNLGSRELDSIAATQIASTVHSVGLQGKLLVIVASLLVHELVEFSWLLVSGTATLRDFLIKTGQHIASALGSLSGGMVGTAVGTMALPGLGTGLGSLAGSIVGASLADLATSTYINDVRKPEPTGCVELILEPMPVDAVPGEKTVRIECPDLDPSGLEHLLEKERKEEEAEREREEFLLIEKHDGGSDEETDDGSDEDEEEDDDDATVDEKMYI